MSKVAVIIVAFILLVGSAALAEARTVVRPCSHKFTESITDQEATLWNSNSPNAL